MYKDDQGVCPLASVGIKIINVILKTNRDLISRSDLQKFLLRIKRDHRIKGLRLDTSGLIEVLSDADTSTVERMILTNLMSKIEEKGDVRERCNTIAKGILDEVEDRDAVFAFLPERLRVAYQSALTSTLARKYLESLYTMKMEGTAAPSPQPEAPPPVFMKQMPQTLSTAVIGDNRPKMEIVLDYADMLDISVERAEILYNAGYTSFGMLKIAPYPNLASLVGKETATYIRERMGNPVSQQEFLSALGVDTRAVPRSKMRMVVPSYGAPMPYAPVPPYGVQKTPWRRKLPKRIAIKRYKARRRRYAACATIFLLTIWGIMFSFWQFGLTTEPKVIPIDWSKEIRYEDPAEQGLPAGSDIVGYAVSFRDDLLTLRTDVNGDIGSDTAFGAYIDLDGSSSTGAGIRSIGADTRIDAVPDAKGTFSCKFFRYKDGGFVFDGNLVCAKKGSTIEMQFARGGLVPSPDAIYSFHTSTKGGFGDESQVVVSYGKGALLVTQMPLIKGVVSGIDSPILQVLAEARGSDVRVDGITFAATGMSYNGTGSFDIKGGESRTIIVSGRSTAPGTEVVSLEVSGVSANAPWSLMGWGLKGYSLSAPATVKIDGAFSDWANIVKYQDGDDGAPVDILEYAVVSQQGTGSFYLRSRGRLAEGTHFPVRVITNASGGSGGGTVIPKVDGNDVMRAFIDIDSNPATGERWNGGAIGADYMCEVQGHDGAIISRDLFEYKGGQWGKIGGISAEVHGQEGEMSIGTALNLSNAKVGFELTNWLDMGDVTDAIKGLFISEPFHNPGVNDSYVPVSPQVPSIDGALNIGAEYALAFHRVFQIYIDSAWRNVDLYSQRNGSALGNSLFIAYTFSGDAGSTIDDGLYIYFEGIALRGHDGALQQNVDRRFYIRSDNQISSAVWNAGGWNNAAWSNVQAAVTYNGGSQTYTFEVRIGLDNIFGSNGQFLSLADKGLRLFFLDNNDQANMDAAYPNQSQNNDATTWADLDFVWLQVNGTSYAPATISPGDTALMEKLELTPSTEEMKVDALTLRMLGNATDADVAPNGAMAYLDNGDGIYNQTTDILLNGSGAAFKSGIVRFVANPLFYLPIKKTVWLVLKINSTATLERTIGVTVTGIDDLIVLGNMSGVVVSLSGLPISSGLSVIRVPELALAGVVVPTAMIAAISMTRTAWLRRIKRYQ